MAMAICSGNRRMSIGLVMYPSKPASRARSRSPVMAWALSATTRRLEKRELRISWSRVKPSLPGYFVTLEGEQRPEQLHVIGTIFDDQNSGHARIRS